MPEGADTILVPSVERSAEVPARAAAAHGDRAVGADLVGEGQQHRIAIDERGAHPHTPVGTLRSAWMSAQLCPIGSTLPGFVRHVGSNALRRRS